MDSLPYIDFDALVQLARASDAVTTSCACTATPLQSWTSLPVSFPESQLARIGTLLEGMPEDATFAEYHPQGTGFWDAEAPVAPRYFPTNRSDVWQCTVCSRAFLRYTEGGGYFVDQRIRALHEATLVDAPLVD